jgi:hypothetical protein
LRAVATVRPAREREGVRAIERAFLVAGSVAVATVAGGNRIG